MRIAPGLLRLKLLLVTEGRRVLTALLILSVVAFGAAGVAYGDPPETERVEQQHRQAVEMDLHTSAVVTGNTSLYERGSRLEEMPTYLLPATPTLQLQLRTSVPADAEVHVSQRLWLTYTATANGEVFWQERRPIASDAGTVSDGTATLSGELNVPQVRDRLRALRNEVGGVGQLSVTLHAAATYETDRYGDSLSSSTPLRATDDAYWLGGDVAADQVHSETVRTSSVDTSQALVTSVPGLGRTVIAHEALLLAGLGLASLVAAGWVGSVRRRDHDVQSLRAEIHERRYAEWISRGRVPPDVGEHFVQTESLESLVDVAIDSSKRVVHDESRGLYTVIDGDAVYYYQPGGFGPFISKEPESDPAGVEGAR